MKIILDVDTGVDDAVAIMIAGVNPKVNLLGITTVSGNVNLKQATKNTLNLLTELSLAKDVYIGEDRPLQIEPYHATDIHGESGLNGQLNHEPLSKVKGHAMEFYLDMINKYPNEISLVCTGPCTNVAKLILNHPKEASKLKNIVLMTGAFFEGGNVTQYAEFNAYCDPHALKVVSDSSIKTTFVGLDVTRKAKLYSQDLHKHDGAVYELLSSIVEGYFNMYEKNMGERAILMHDPLALMIAINPELVSYRTGSCNVILEGEKAGKTEYSILGDNEVSEHLNIDAFRSYLNDALKDLVKYHVR